MQFGNMTSTESDSQLMTHIVNIVFLCLNYKRRFQGLMYFFLFLGLVLLL